MYRPPFAALVALCLVLFAQPVAAATMTTSRTYSNIEGDLLKFHITYDNSVDPSSETDLTLWQVDGYDNGVYAWSDVVVAAGVVDDGSLDIAISIDNTVIGAQATFDIASRWFVDTLDSGNDAHYVYESPISDPLVVYAYGDYALGGSATFTRVAPEPSALAGSLLLGLSVPLVRRRRRALSA